jgi:hypothetical protein
MGFVISLPHMRWDCIGSLGMCGWEVMRHPTHSRGAALPQSLWGQSRAVGVSRQELRNKISHWLGNQHRRRWQKLSSAQRQAREFISVPCQGTSVRFLSFNRTQSRVVTGLLTGHNTLQRHLHLMGLTDSPLCRKCGAEEEISAHILCQCESLASIRHAYLGSSFLKPEDIKSQNLGAIWCFSKVAGLP